MTRKHIVTIIGLFFLWRMGLFLISAGAGFVLPYAPSFPYATTLLPSFDLPQWLYSFANFDGVHYLTIAKEGYLQTNFIQAFFPLYPFVLLHSVHLLLPSVNLLLMGLLVSHLAFLGFLILSFDFVERKYGVRVEWRFVLAVLLFPWSLFLASLYTESLFLFLVILCFWLADKKRWYLASLALMFLSATRIVGVMMIPALLIELWLSGDRDWKKYAAIIFGSLGLFGYMAYLFVHFQDPLYFLHVQEAFGAGRSNGITLYPQVAYRSLKILLTTAFNFKYITYLQEFLAGTIGVIAILIPWRRVSPGITFFALSTVLIPTISGSFLSMGRFLIPALPLYILMALFASKHPRLAWIWYIASALVLILNTLLFIQGYWVASFFGGNPHNISHISEKQELILVRNSLFWGDMTIQEIDFKKIHGYELARIWIAEANLNTLAQPMNLLLINIASQLLIAQRHAENPDDYNSGVKADMAKSALASHISALEDKAPDIAATLQATSESFQLAVQTGVRL